MAKKVDYGELLAELKDESRDTLKSKLFEKHRDFACFYENGFLDRREGKEHWIAIEDIECIYRFEDVLNDLDDSKLNISYLLKGESYTLSMSEGYYKDIINVASKVLEHENWKHLKKIDYPKTTKWILAASAMMSIFWTKNPTIFGEPVTEELTQSLRDDLYEFYDINDNESMNSTFTYFYYGPFFPDYEDDENLDVFEIIEELNREREENLDIIDEWTHDLYRLLMTANNAVSARFCTKEEGLDWSLKAGLLVQALHNSWDEYHDSYIRGYSEDFDQDVEDEDSNAFARNKIYNETKIRPENPWETDFNTKLKKEW